MGPDIVPMFIVVLRVSRGHSIGEPPGGHQCSRGVCWHPYSPVSPVRACYEPPGPIYKVQRRPTLVQAYN